MRKIRIGNDIDLLWRITAKGGLPYKLDGKDLLLFLSNLQGTVRVDSFIVKDNTLKWTFFGKDQKHTGVYRLELVENSGKEGMHTVDSCDAFSLVSSSSLEGGVGCSNVSIETVELSSTIDLALVQPVIPEIGENGNWYIQGVDTGKRAVALEEISIINKMKVDEKTGTLYVL